MWRALTEFVLQVKASGLSHEATIEILIALLGVMVAVLTLISGLFAFILTVVGWFGFQTIRDEAIKKADKVARSTARTTARQVANRVRKQILSEEQAVSMPASQEPAESEITVNTSQQSLFPKKQRRRAISDENLNRENKV